MLLLGGGAAARLHAQVTATVPASSGVYDQLESVSAFFPVRGLFLGERPMSRRDVIRAIALLERAIDSAPPALGSARKEWARRELGAVAGAMNRERGVYRSSRTVVAFTTDEEVTRSDAQPERITSNGLGSIDAVTHPFEAARQGSDVSRRLGAEHEARFSARQRQCSRPSGRGLKRGGAAVALGA